MEEDESLEFHCTEIKEITNLPHSEIIEQISKLLSSGEYERVNLLLQKKSNNSDDNSDDDSQVSFIVQNDGKMKIEGSHLSKLLSRLSRFGGLPNSDGFDKIKGFNKRFSKHFADSNYVGQYQYNKGSYQEAI